MNIKKISLITSVIILGAIFFYVKSMRSQVEQPTPPAPMEQPVANLKVGESAYIDMKYLVPGQMRYSQKNIDLKIASTQKNRGFTQEGGVTKLQHNNGTSAFTIREAAPVMKIKDPNGTIAYVLKDAHHDTLVNQALARHAGITSPMMPITVKDDFSNMKYQDFWNYAFKNNLVDLIGVDGKNYMNNPPTDFSVMKNDPVRYFVTISAYKGGNNEFDRSFGADYPLWYKRLANSASPSQYPGDVINGQMIENVVSQKLIDNGFNYDDRRDGEKGPNFEAKVKEAHAILSKPQNQIQGLRLVKQLGNVNDIRDQLRVLANEPDPLAKK